MFSTCFACDANALFSVMFVCDNSACGRLFCQKCAKGFLKTSCPRCGHAGTLKQADELKKLFQSQDCGDAQSTTTVPEAGSKSSSGSRESTALSCPHCGGDLPADAQYKVCPHCRNRLFWDRNHKPYETREAAEEAVRRAAEKAKQSEDHRRARREQTPVLERLISLMHRYAESKGGWFSSPGPVSLSADTRLDSLKITEVPNLVADLIEEFGEPEQLTEYYNRKYLEGPTLPFDWINIRGLGTIGAAAAYIERVRGPKT